MSTRSATRTTLLDVAERLFGEHGYDGASLRLIASEAGTNLGAVNYHFKTKRALYAETFLRRFRPVNVARARQLAIARGEAGASPLTARQLLDCLLRPAYEVARSHPLFARLLARNMITPPEFFREIMTEETDFIVQTFGPELLRSAGGLAPDRLFLRLHLSAGALLFIAAVPLPLLTDGSASSTDKNYEELLTYTTAGFLAGMDSSGR